MNTIVWLLALIVLGLVTGKIIGMGLTFTRGRTSYDLAAGLIGALIVAVPVRALGLTGYSETLPTLIIGVTAAIMATWVTRIVTWKSEPLSLTPTERVEEEKLQLSQDVMTTGDGTKLYISGGRLVAPDVVGPTAEAAGPA